MRQGWDFERALLRHMMYQNVLHEELDDEVTTVQWHGFTELIQTVKLGLNTGRREIPGVSQKTTQKRKDPIKDASPGEYPTFTF